ncbi:hypothetical protein Tco_0718799 [Tanacetum coccineum]
MIEEIKVYLMQRLFAMNQNDVNLNDIIYPSIRKEIKKLNQYQRYWSVFPSRQQEFEIRKADEGFGVNLNTETCTYKRWNLFGIPCIHAVDAYCMLNQDPGIRVSSWYSKQIWVDAYSHSIKPVGGSSLWVESANPPPLPFKKRIMPGRPRKKRIKHVTDLSIDPSADPSVDSSADPAPNKNVADPTLNQSFTGLLNAVERDAKIAALADMNEAEEREAKRKDAERVLEE